MAKASGRPSWFKVFLHQKAAIDEMPDEIVGRAFKAALQYFETGDIPDIELAARGVFAPMRESVNEAFADFERTSNKNRENVQKRWEKKRLPSYTSGMTGTSGINSLQSDTKYTEAEAEVYKGNKVKKEREGMFSEENIRAPDVSAVDPPLSEMEERLYSAALSSGKNSDEALAWVIRKRKTKDGDGA